VKTRSLKCMAVQRTASYKLALKAKRSVLRINKKAKWTQAYYSKRKRKLASKMCSGHFKDSYW